MENYVDGGFTGDGSQRTLVRIDSAIIEGSPCRAIEVGMADYGRREMSRAGLGAPKLGWRRETAASTYQRLRSEMSVQSRQGWAGASLAGAGQDWGLSSAWATVGNQ